MSKKLSLTSTPVICLGAMLCCLLWGSAGPFIKTGYALLGIEASDTMAQLLFAGIRFTIAGILTVVFGSLVSKKPLIPKKSSYFNIFKLSLVQTVMQYIFFYVGLAHASGVNSSIVGASNVFLCIVFSTLVFRFEKMTVNKVIGCIIGFAGVVMINLAGGQLGSASLFGEGAIFMSSVAYGISSCLIKKYSDDENTVVLSGYQFFIGGIILTVVALIGGGRIEAFTVKSFSLLIYLAMVSSVAYTLWGILLKHNPVAKVSVFGFMNPVFGVIISAIVLGENNQAFSPQGILALALVCLGIYIVNRQKANKSTTTK